MGDVDGGGTGTGPPGGLLAYREYTVGCKIIICLERLDCEGKFVEQ